MIDEREEVTLVGGGLHSRRGFLSPACLLEPKPLKSLGETFAFPVLSPTSASDAWKKDRNSLNGKGPHFPLTLKGYIRLIDWVES